jgi:hypothetical protein
VKNKICFKEWVILRKRIFYTTDYNEDESEILIRDIEGILIDALSSEDKEKNLSPSVVRNNTYKNWNYTKKS